MEQIDKELLTINKSICDNIEMLAPDYRGLLSQNILSQLRNLVEHVSFKIFSNGRDLDVTYENICKGNIGPDQINLQVFLLILKNL